MRAMVLESPRPVEQRPLRLADIDEPQAGPGEIRVRVRCCGLCHTDLHTVEGELALPRTPIVPGHQIVGIVDQLGKGVTTFKRGDRVGVPWLYSTDGTCRYCRSATENLCQSARFTGLHVNGGYAEAMVVRQDFAYALPAQFTDSQAAPLLCAGVIGYRALRMSEAKDGERIGLFGFGASAHIVIQLARHLWMGVYVFTRAESHRQLARELGAGWVGSATDQPPDDLDAAIIFAPAGALVLDALRHVRKGGRVILAGITMSAIPEMDYSLIYGERVLRSVANASRQDARDFLALAAKIPVRTEVQMFALEDANHALEAMKHSRVKGAGVLQVSRESL